MSNATTIEIMLNDRLEVLERLRRLTDGAGKPLMQTDESGNEYYETLYNSTLIRFYAGHPRVLPKEWADGLRQSNAMPMDEKCKQCKATGQLITGQCHVCNGTRWVLTNKQFNLFKVKNEVDPLSLDLTSAPTVKAEAEPVVAAKAGN